MKPFGSLCSNSSTVGFSQQEAKNPVPNFAFFFLLLSSLVAQVGIVTGTRGTEILHSGLLYVCPFLHPYVSFKREQRDAFGFLRESGLYELIATQPVNLSSHCSGIRNLKEQFQVSEP